MNQTIKISRKEAAPFLQAAGIQYTGRKFQIELSERITFSDTNWGDGTRNQYHLLNMNTSNAKTIVAPAPWCNPIEGKTVELPAGGIVLEHSIFCGHDCGITIHARPDQIQWLKA